MERKIPVPGSFYRHFKGNIYQIRDIATHSETGEKMVVYQAMYPPFGTWVRPLAMFLERVDNRKYPNARQQYRFEQIVWKNTQNRENPSEDKGTAESPSENDGLEKKTGSVVEIPDDRLKQIIMEGQAEKLLTGVMQREEIAQKGLMLILDAHNYNEKRKLFLGLRQYLEETHLSSIAVALDIVLEDGDAGEHFDAILYCLEKWEQYEGGRLRQ